MVKVLRACAFLCVVLVVGFGCGGGSGSPSGAPGSGVVSIYLTDSFNADFSHVWVKLRKISLEGPDDLVVFDDPAGKLVDLAALRDANGLRFQFLADSVVTPAKYVARIELDENLSLVRTGSTALEPHQFSTSQAFQGQPGVTLLRLESTFAMFSGRNQMVVDFDLARWQMDGSARVIATVTRASNGLLPDRKRHEHATFRGTTGPILGSIPNRTFELPAPLGPITVKTDSSTRFFNRSGADNPTLSQGEPVEVRGEYIGGILYATSIAVEDDPRNFNHRASGPVLNALFQARAFDLQPDHPEGFAPEQELYHIDVDGSMTLLSDGGTRLTEDEFMQTLVDLGSDASVVADGNANGLNFRPIRIQVARRGVYGDIHVQGLASAIGPNSGVLTIKVVTWNGAEFSTDQLVRVVAAPTALYRLNGTASNKSAFFGAISNGASVAVSGSFDGSKFTAYRLEH